MAEPCRHPPCHTKANHIEANEEEPTETTEKHHHEQEQRQHINVRINGTHYYDLLMTIVM